MFQPLPDDFSYPKQEESILEYWEANDVFARSQQLRQSAPAFTFYEGPPTVNGKPGIHHILARTIKDSICRYKNMRGFSVRRQAGWDTHGLPVELSAEKELGITDKAQIEVLGVDVFNKACRDIVYRNITMDSGWRTLTRRMGHWLDLDSAYITCTNDYIESVWWALKQFFDKGLIYRGYKVVPQSPTLGTPLSSHELSQNYKDVRDPNVYLKLRLTSSRVAGLEGASVLVWTTTPWTLFANVALAVGPEIIYVRVRNTRTVGEQQIVEDVILAESRLPILDGEVEIIASYRGTDLVGSHYEQIFTDVRIDSNEYPHALTILPGEFVSTEDGSGIVHLAPAFGQDDFEMSKLFNLPVPQPVSPNGHFTEEIRDYAGRAVKSFTYSDHTEEGADRDIVKALKISGKIYKASFDYLHSYPHCWRTDNPVIYYARDSWFIRSPKYRERLVELNKTVHWHPEEIGEGRFGNWLEEVKEWSISRDRYWGSPLPIWVSEDGSSMFAVGSIDELRTGLYEREDGSKVPVSECGMEIDLHRPFVDRVVFDRDGVTYRRTREVVDVWFDSGSMPFAQFHYPFENKEIFESSFPADFIAEGIDQTRGWFYTLHNISTALFGAPAYRNVVVNDLVLDKRGQKMSKSRGNTVDPFEVMSRFGSDAIRWFLMASSPVHKPKLWNEEDIAKTVIADFFRSLTNTYEFFALYANVDGYSSSDALIPVSHRPEIDRWIISRLNTLMKSYQSAMDDYDLTRACRVIQEFTIEEVSNWYVRRNRRRFWKGEYDDDKRAAYQTLHEVLLRIAEMMAPVAPFLSESIFLRLRMHDEQFSIHCSILQSCDESVIDNELEHRMKQAQRIVSLARSLREKAKIKTRQPLRRILLPVDSPQMRRQIQSVEDIITEEINVKDIEYVSDDTNIVRRSARPNFKVIGKKYGTDTQAVANSIKSMTHDDVRRLEQSSVLMLTIGEKTVQIDFEDVEIISEDIEGWLVATDAGTTVALDTELDESLVREGLAREFVSRLQKLRKDSGYNVTDRISVEYSTDDETSAAIESMRSYIGMETLAEALERGGQFEGTELEINGRHVNVRVKRV
ncbi:MAG: isoleucine--tRNA ligase [Candidatus Kapabacteria bacterium]|nr:isoleucine--tRNA ligase [Candidatus Kapabacteria bacterium]